MIGWLVYLLLVVGGLALLLHSARRHRLLMVVLVGLAVRAAVMVVTHLVSSHGGEHGFMYLDDITYADDGTLLSEQWGHGHFVNPVSVNYVGSYVAGFSSLVGVVFTLVGPQSLLPVKVVNVLLSGGSVLLGARIAAKVFGEEAERRAAWLLALAPTLVWWAAPMLKEALATFLLLAVVMMLLPPHSWRALIGSVVLLMLLAFTRTQAALAIVIAALIVASVAIIRHRAQFDLRSLTPRLGRLLIVLVGVPVVCLLLVGQGHPSAAFSALASTATSMFHTYQGGNIVHLPVDAVKSWISPYPWIFSSATHNWDRALYPGMWALYAAAPTILYGVVRLRKSSEGMFIFLTIFLYTLLNAAATGFVVRQRAPVEALLVVPLIAGLRDWRTSVRAGAVAVALVAAPAAADHASAGTVGAILSLAIALALVSLVLPDRKLEGTSPLARPWINALKWTDTEPTAARGGRHVVLGVTHHFPGAGHANTRLVDRARRVLATIRTGRDA